jgi:hypothetical protein
VYQKINQSFINLLISFLIVSLIFIEFLIQNFNQLDVVLLFDTTIWFSSLILLNFVIFCIKRDKIIIFASCVYLFFKFEYIAKLSISNKHDGEFALIIIILIIFLLYYFKEKLQNFLKYFFLVYFFILIPQIFFLDFEFLKSNHQYFNNYYDKNNNNTFQYFDKHELKDLNEKRNIYLVILDGMVSLEEFKNQHNSFNLIDTKQLLNEVELFYIKDSKSVFPTSHLTFSSIANLKAIKTPDSEKYSNRNDFFPAILLLPENHEKYPKLIKALNQIEYSFKWIGSAWADCNKYNIRFCLGYDEENNSRNLKIDYLLNYNISTVNDFFLSQTPIKSILFNLNYLILNNKKYFQWEHKANDGIGKFLKAIKYFDFKKNKNYFFWIHHNSPHWPYVFNSDCSERIDDVSVNNNFEGYKMAYLCNIKKIEIFMNYINKHDPTAIVILQGDHGFEFDPTGNLKNSGFTRENARKRLDHFNAVKINKKCKKFLSKNIGNINGVRLALSCAIDKTPRLIEEKNFIGFYENQEGYGQIYDFQNFKLEEQVK